MLALASIEQELNIRTTVAYICCANHSVLMTTPSITALAEGSHRLTAVLWLLRRCEQSFVDCCGGRSNL